MPEKLTHEGQVDRHVGLRARMGLHVGRFGAEESAGPVDGGPLGPVHHLAAAVVALPGQSLGVLVGEYRSERLQDGGADEVLRGDQFEL